MSLSDPVSAKTAIIFDQMHNILIGAGYAVALFGYNSNSWLVTLIGALTAFTASIHSSENVRRSINDAVINTKLNQSGGVPESKFPSGGGG